VVAHISYGPATKDLEPAFLLELNELCPLRFGPWLLAGDFNMIYRAADKNNDRLNLRMMGRFHRFLNDASLKELHLEGRLFTWSNERSHPTLERIDKAFISQEWDELHPKCDLRSLASGCLDHAPPPSSVDRQCPSLP
jgi:endonuclease/exonuclease/phosphatase family metal-dependent hydrolase